MNRPPRPPTPDEVAQAEAAVATALSSLRAERASTKMAPGQSSALLDRTEIEANTELVRASLVATATRQSRLNQHEHRRNRSPDKNDDPGDNGSPCMGDESEPEDALSGDSADPANEQTLQV